MEGTQLEITASIVLHNEDFDELSRTIQSFLAIPEKKLLFLIDNDSRSSYREAFKHPSISYIENDKNLGFAKAHNQVISEISGHSKFHLVLNPDVRFDSNVISQLISQMETEPNLALIAPKMLFPNGNHQYTARKYPGFFELFLRGLGWFPGYTSKKEYRDKDLNEAFYPEFLHGCFLLFRTHDFIEIGGFDERYFLYMEDLDICRKLDAVEKKKMYFPKAVATHTLRKASSKNPRMFFIHLSSTLKYFKKWGFV